MADLSVTPVGTQVRPVQGMSLAEMINAARGAQEYSQALQLNPLQLEKAQAELQRLQQLMPEEIAKAKAERKVSEETVEPRIGAAKSTATTAEAQAQEARLKVFQNYLANTRMEAADLLKQPEITYEDVVNKFTQSINNATDDEALRKQILAQGLQSIPKGLSSDQYRGFLANSLVKTVSTEQQLATRFPSVSLVSTGAKTGVPITTGGAMAVQQPGQVGAGGIPMELPVGTQVYNAKTGQYEYVGAPSGAPAVAKPAAATTALEQSRGAVISKDLPEVIAKAADAPARIAIFQNIKKLAPEAFTGVASERRQAIASFAQMLGISAYEAETAATDELLKNTNLLTLAGGNTDAAREMARFANPNTKMTKEGINRVANQLISIEEMNMARARYMGPVQNDPAGYFQRKLDFDAIADPRLFLDLDDAEYEKMWNAMKPKEKEKFKFMSKKAKAMGVIP